MTCNLDEQLNFGFSWQLILPIAIKKLKLSIEGDYIVPSLDFVQDLLSVLLYAFTLESYV